MFAKIVRTLFTEMKLRSNDLNIISETESKRKQCFLKCSKSVREPWNDIDSEKFKTSDNKTINSLGMKLKNVTEPWLLPFTSKLSHVSIYNIKSLNASFQRRRSLIIVLMGNPHSVLDRARLLSQALWYSSRDFWFRKQVWRSLGI